MSHNASKCYEKTTFGKCCTAALILRHHTPKPPSKDLGPMNTRYLSEIGFVRPILTNPNPTPSAFTATTRPQNVLRCSTNVTQCIKMLRKNNVLKMVQGGHHSP